MKPTGSPRIALRGIVKRYGAVVANDRVDLDVAAGCVHAVVGENGAGKTTLMRIIAGLVEPEAGRYELDGRPVHLRGPMDAIRRGIGMVHQRFQLVEELSALENLVLGAAPGRLLFDRRRARAAARELAQQLATELDWEAPVARLSVGVRQRLEIMRLLYRRADILIFDEPTSVLTPAEAEVLFGIMRRLAADGRTILFISHKLPEVFAVARWVTVMRRGRVVATSAVADTDPRQIGRQMLGEDLAPPALRASGSAGRPLLALREVSVVGERGEPRLRQVSLEVAAGEIVGVAGVEGNGQRELVEVATGLRQPAEGEVFIAGRPCGRRSVRERRDLGVAFISEDRDGEGASLDATIADNAVATSYRRPPLARAGLLSPGRVRRATEELIQRFGVQGGGPRSPARELSGGNLQRLVVGRELGQVPRVLIASHPTRGVDLRGTAFIRRLLHQARTEGAAILLVSEEIAELLELCDRILVLYRGRVTAELPIAQATAERLGALMAGLAA